MSNQHLAEMFFQSARIHSGETAVRIQIDGKWRTHTYQEMSNIIRQIGRALLALGVQPGDR
ncbi:MAG: long-chain fatty acid--CoA ligase, partial [Ardenticatenaceae bacterium]|nr:long-chain fatty acid--CoA ligase [Ardenticatenaceae bacterium]